MHGYAQAMIRAGTKVTAAACAAAVMVWSATTVSAQQAQQLGVHDSWVAFAYETTKGKVCYVVSQPQDSEPKNVRRDDIYFMVTHRPGQNIKNEVMTIIGYPFKKGSDAVAEIGANKFDMFTSGDGAWVEKPATEANIVGAMKRGASMVIKGTSWRGTKTVDQYSLSGVTAALDQISDACK